MTEPRRPAPTRTAPARSAPAPAPSKPGKPGTPGTLAPPPWWRTLRADPPFPIRIAIGAGLIALVFLVWWFVTRGDAITAIVSPSKLPSPGAVIRSFGRLGGNLSDGIISTLERVVAGVLLAAVIGVVLGVFAATNRAIGSAVAPVVIFLRSIPMGG